MNCKQRNLEGSTARNQEIKLASGGYYHHPLFCLTAGELEQADVVIHGVVRELHALAHYCDVAPEVEI